MKPIPHQSSVADDSAKKSGLLLYVEDHEENWNATKVRLDSRYDLLWAATDKEALRLVVEHEKSLFAILMDIELKGSVLNGIALTKLFRGRDLGMPIPSFAQNAPRLKCPIVFVTAYGTRYPEADLLAMGGNIVAEKPVDFHKLTLALGRFGPAASAQSK